MLSAGSPRRPFGDRPLRRSARSGSTATRPRDVQAAPGPALWFSRSIGLTIFVSWLPYSVRIGFSSVYGLIVIVRLVVVVVVVIVVIVIVIVIVVVIVSSQSASG